MGVEHKLAALCTGHDKSSSSRHNIAALGTCCPHSSYRPRSLILILRQGCLALRCGAGQVTKYVEREILNHRVLMHPHIVQFKEVSAVHCSGSSSTSRKPARRQWLSWLRAHRCS